MKIKKILLKIRLTPLNKMKKIDMYHINVFKWFWLSNKDNYDITHVIFDNICNIIEFYDRIEEINYKIKEKNELIVKSNLNEKKTSNEKSFWLKLFLGLKVGKKLYKNMEIKIKKIIILFMKVNKLVEKNQWELNWKNKWIIFIN